MKFTILITKAKLKNQLNFASFLELHLFPNIFACKIWIHDAVTPCNPSHKTVL